MRVVIDRTAKTLRLEPQNDTDHEDLSALGFLEGGDSVLLVRQDIPGTSDLDFLDAVCTPEQWSTLRNGPKYDTIAGPRP
jgi:hypothetical protein